MRETKTSPLFILFIHLGIVGGVERKIFDIVNFLGEYSPDLPIFILVRRKSELEWAPKIKNKKVKVINYTDWAGVKIPYFFPFFVFYHVWKLKPQAILAFLDFVSIPSILSKLLLFWRKIKVVLSEDHYASRIISLQRFAPLRHLSVRLFYPLADVVLTCTQATKKDLIVSYGIPEEKIRIVRNWTSFGETELKRKRKKYDFIYVGRFAKTKNLRFLLKMIRELKKKKKNLQLCLVGSGEEEANLSRLVTELRLEGNVEFAGARHDVTNFLLQSKIFVFTSVVRAEGLPLVILEAMAVGTPVLTRAFAGADEFLTDGENCMMFTGEDDFIKKALWLLKNPHEGGRISKKARRLVRRRHSSKNIHSYLEELGLKK